MTILKLTLALAALVPRFPDQAGGPLGEQGPLPFSDGSGARRGSDPLARRNGRVRPMEQCGFEGRCCPKGTCPGDMSAYMSPAWLVEACPGVCPLDMAKSPPRYAEVVRGGVPDRPPVSIERRTKTTRGC
jgi:hypothetical protein